MEVGAAIREVREGHLRISQGDLARLIGVSQPAIWQWEHGGRFPHQRYLVRLSTLADVVAEVRTK